MEETRGLRMEETKGLRMEETGGLRMEETRGLRMEETRLLRMEETRGLRMEETRFLRETWFLNILLHHNAPHRAGPKARYVKLAGLVFTEGTQPCPGVRHQRGLARIERVERPDAA